MKTYSHTLHPQHSISAQLPHSAAMSSWLPRALSLLGLTIAMLALVALTGCKDAGKSGPAGADTGGTPPPLSAPPSAPPSPSSPPATDKPAGGGMSAPPPSGAASAPGDAGTKP